MALSDLKIDCKTVCKPQTSEPGISRSTRETPPSHFLFNIQSYSLLRKSGIDKFETDVFQAGGYKWRLVLYPNGDYKSNGTDHVSLYLAITETDKLSRGWKIDVTFKFFVKDQTNNKYLTIQDADGAVRSFSETDMELGFAKMIPLETFCSSDKGYLVDDDCVFGAEVFVIGRCAKQETLSMIPKPEHGTFTWKLQKFSKLEDDTLYSNKFRVGERDWKLMVYPKGMNEDKGKNFSLYLEMENKDNLGAKRIVYADFTLRVVDQLHSKHRERKVCHSFTAAISKFWGYKEFISLRDVYDASNGFIQNDTLTVEVQFHVISVSKVST